MTFIVNLSRITYSYIYTNIYAGLTTPVGHFKEFHAEKRSTFQNFYAEKRSTFQNFYAEKRSNFQNFYVKRLKMSYVSNETTSSLKIRGGGLNPPFQNSG